MRAQQARIQVMQHLLTAGMGDPDVIHGRRQEVAEKYRMCRPALCRESQGFIGHEAAALDAGATGPALKQFAQNTSCCCLAHSTR
jgi:hypothetical protein